MFFQRDILEKELGDPLKDICVFTRFFEANNRFIVNQLGKKVERGINKLYSKTVYGGQIIITNMSNLDLQCEVFY